MRAHLAQMTKRPRLLAEILLISLGREAHVANLDFDLALWSFPVAQCLPTAFYD
jgi:hypothetical protein